VLGLPLLPDGENRVQNDDGGDRGGNRSRLAEVGQHRGYLE
jgi:hypothetical protein